MLYFLLFTKCDLLSPGSQVSWLSQVSCLPEADAVQGKDEMLRVMCLTWITIPLSRLTTQSLLEQTMWSQLGRWDWDHVSGIQFWMILLLMWMIFMALSLSQLTSFENFFVPISDMFDTSKSWTYSFVVLIESKWNHLWDQKNFRMCHSWFLIRDNHINYFNYLIFLCFYTCLTLAVWPFFPFRN